MLNRHLINKWMFQWKKDRFSSFKVELDCDSFLFLFEVFVFTATMVINVAEKVGSVWEETLYNKTY